MNTLPIANQGYIYTTFLIAFCGVLSTFITSVLMHLMTYILIGG